jgi:hypothetical protein
MSELPATLHEVLRFASVLPQPAEGDGSFRVGHPPGPLRKWVDIPIAEIRDELILRNGRFQAMLGWMRHSLQACLVLDTSGRLIFLNSAAEHYWKARLWDLQGQNLCQIMRLNELETARNRSERERVLSQRFPEVFLEHFHNGGQRISMFCFPFPDDNNDLLLGAFILPHSGPAGMEHRAAGY